jgi:recombination protein RecR
MFPEALKKLIQDLASLPGLGPRSAERIALYLLEQEQSFLNRLGEGISGVKESVGLCPRCFGFSSGGLCDICSDERRDKKVLCVVENPMDIYPLEKTGGYKGLYFVLGGLVDPLRGKLLSVLRREELKKRLAEGEVREVILAFDFSFEGEATATLIAEEFAGFKVKFSRLARGLPSGAELEFADEQTLLEALKFRREVGK